MSLIVFLSFASLRFQEKYHPVVKTKRETVVRQQLRTRANAFIGLLQSGRLDKLALDSEHAEAVIKILDSGETVRY